jgi:hypothetical protein
VLNFISYLREYHKNDIKTSAPKSVQKFLGPIKAVVREDLEWKLMRRTDAGYLINCC